MIADEVIDDNGSLPDADADAINNNGGSGSADSESDESVWEDEDEDDEELDLDVYDTNADVVTVEEVLKRKDRGLGRRMHVCTRCDSTTSVLLFSSHLDF